MESASHLLSHHSPSFSPKWRGKYPRDVAFSSQFVDVVVSSAVKRRNGHGALSRQIPKGDRYCVALMLCKHPMLFGFYSNHRVCVCGNLYFLKIYWNNILDFSRPSGGFSVKHGKSLLVQNTKVSKY